MIKISDNRIDNGYKKHVSLLNFQYCLRKGNSIVYKLISCWVFVCMLIVGSLNPAQGQESSGWEKAHKESLARVEAADKEVMVKAEKEAMAMAAMVKAEEAMAKAEEAIRKIAEATSGSAAKADNAMTVAEVAKMESSAKAEEAMQKAEKAMAMAEKSAAKAEKAMAKAEAAMARADESMAKAEKAKKESTAKVEEEAVIERQQRRAWEFWK